MACRGWIGEQQQPKMNVYDNRTIFWWIVVLLPMVEGRATAAGPGPWNSAAIGPRLNVKAPVDPPPPPPLPLTKAGDMLLIQSICQILPAPRRNG